MISLEGFEVTMMEMFQEENPQILDDDLPDKFSDWISNCSYQDIQAMSAVYCYKMGQHAAYLQLAEDYWTKNFGPLPTKYQPDLRIEV